MKMVQMSNDYFNTIRYYFPELTPVLPAEVTWDTFELIWLYSPPGMLIDMLIYFISRFPTMSDLWEIKSLMSTMYNIDKTPLNWLGDYFAIRNERVFPDWTRTLTTEAPQNEFYTVVPWAW